jgi:HNH endonuclease
MLELMKCRPDSDIEVIRLTRIDLTPDLQDRLASRTRRLVKRDADSSSARRSWKTAARERTGVKHALQKMALGIERCMYCGDSRGTDIDHFQPIKVAPLRAFDWDNHLLACGSCNSNAKRDAYPCDGIGECLLINPTSEEPSDHLRLTLNDGRYTGLTPKGCATIDVFHLNRSDLRTGREKAFRRCRSMLRDYLYLEASQQLTEAAETREALELQPFADVLQAMYRIALLPNASTVLGGHEVVMLLMRWNAGLESEIASRQLLD